MRELIYINTRPSGGRHSAPVRDIGNRDIIINQVSGLGLGEVLVKDSVEPARLINVPVHAVLNALRRVPHEVVRLALHGADAGVLEEEPVVHLIVLARALRKGDLVLRVVLLCHVLEDAARLKQADLLPIAERISQGGDATIGVDL